MNKNEQFEIERSWKQKHMPEDIAHRNFVVRCSLKIRNHIMTVSNGYVYIQLMRCRVYDFVDPQMCFHCRRFTTHRADNCPEKASPPTCAHCMGSHYTKNCNQKENKKCCNCVRSKAGNSSHSAFSKRCPVYLAAKEAMLKKLDFSEIPAVPLSTPSTSSKNSVFVS